MLGTMRLAHNLSAGAAAAADLPFVLLQLVLLVAQARRMPCREVLPPS